MPSYQKQKSGKIKAIVRKAGHPTKIKTFPNKLEATRWATAYEAAIETANSSLQDDMSFTTVIPLYLQDCALRLKRPEKEEALWRGMESWLKDYTVRTLTPLDIDHYLKSRLKSVQTATARKDALWLSRVYTFVIKKLHQDVINPITLIDLPKDSKPRDRLLTDNEVRLLLDNVSDTMRPWFELAIETGMRRAELVNLEWSWVNLVQRTISLPDTITKNGCKREVPLSSKAVEVLSTLGVKTHGRVFDVTISGVSSAFRCVRIRCGLHGARLHDLRHLAITRAAAKGLSTVQLSVLSGHKTLAMLARYTHVQAKDVAGLLD